MTYGEALDYIHGISWEFCKPGLDRTRELCERLGNPQNALKFIHVAGTNGKGSFCSMLSEVLMAEGLRVGLYTSPYIITFNERMRVNGGNIKDERLAEITEKVRPHAEAMAEKPTEFELITAIAFQYFYEEKVDVVVLEAGMGGRLDSTNVIENPLLSVITGVALDHTAYLGDTVEKIAFEKAGIIKDGAPVLLGGENESVREIVSGVAKKKASQLYTVDYSALTVKERSLFETLLDYKSHTGIGIRLHGSYQPRNCAAVLEAVDILRQGGLHIREAAVKKGLQEARWPARFEILSTDPIVIYDGAHNPEGVDAAVESIKDYFGEKKVIALSGVLGDKDYSYIAKKISDIADVAYTITPENPRALNSEEYAEELRKNGVDATACCSVGDAAKKAFERAKKERRPLICLGSLYTYGDVLYEITFLN